MMKPEHEERLQAIKDRANAASDGPWEWEAADPSHLRLGPASAGIEEKDVLACSRCEGCIESERAVKEAGKFTRADRAWARCDWPEIPNSDFIAHSREDIPWLIERLCEAEKDRLQRRRAWWRIPVRGKVQGDFTTDYEEQGKGKFANHLERSSQIVSTWPSWKQSVLGGRVQEHGKAEVPIPHCKISELHPGDTIVFKYSGVLSQDAVARLSKSVAAVFGNDYRVIVLEGGAELEIVRPKNEKQEPAYMAALRRDAATNRAAAMILEQIEAEAEAEGKGETSERIERNVDRSYKAFLGEGLDGESVRDVSVNERETDDKSP